MSDVIENKVARSGLITINLEELKPSWKITSIDIAPWLWQGIALKEKDFRKSVDEHDWSVYQNHHVALYCSEDAIIPLWAWMLVTSRIQPHAKSVIKGSESDLKALLWREVIHTLELDDYANSRVIIKGCGEEAISESIYAELTFLLQPVVKTLMFGEPCSTVPVYKRK